MLIIHHHQPHSRPSVRACVCVCVRVGKETPGPWDKAGYREHRLPVFIMAPPARNCIALWQSGRGYTPPLLPCVWIDPYLVLAYTGATCLISHFPAMIGGPPAITLGCPLLRAAAPWVYVPVATIACCLLLRVLAWELQMLLHLLLALLLATCCGFSC